MSDEALRDILDIAHGWAGPEATASNARRIEVITSIAEDALFRAHLRDRDADISGTSHNRWLATRFDAVTLAKAHHNDLTPAQVDLIVGPPFADKETA